jgi:hypothetical protein
MHQWEPVIAPGPTAPWANKSGGGMQSARTPIIVKRAIYKKDELGTYKCVICGCQVFADEMPDPQPRDLQGCIRLAPKPPSPANEVA